MNFNNLEIKRNNKYNSLYYHLYYHQYFINLLESKNILIKLFI